MTYRLRHRLARELVVAAIILSAVSCKEDGSANGGTGGSTIGETASRGGSPPAASSSTSADGAAKGGTTGAAGSDGAASAPPPPPVSCTIATDKSRPIVATAGRDVYCAIDLGSNSAKLQIVSMEPGQPLSFKSERQCSTRLGFGAIVFDSTTQVSGPLPAGQILNLVTTIAEFQQLCALDGGRMVGAEATQWARDATNMDEVKESVRQATSLDVEILTAQEEGIYGYVAATRNTPERFALDPGSNSFQLSWWPSGATSVRTMSVPFGYARGAAAYYAADATATYSEAREQHAQDLRTRIDTALAELTPPTSLALLKQAVSEGSLRSEIFLGGQDGALHLAVRGLLRDATGTWIGTSADYKARVALEVPEANSAYGDVTTVLTPSEVDTFFSDVIKPDDFLVLRTAPVRTLYGEKTLANAVLLHTVVKELGLTAIIAVPQEMPAGYILAKVAATQS